MIDLTRETLPAADVNGRIAGPGVGYVRIAAIGRETTAHVKSQIAELTKKGAGKLVIDVRPSIVLELERAIVIGVSRSTELRIQQNQPAPTVAAAVNVNLAVLQRDGAAEAATWLSKKIGDIGGLLLGAMATLHSFARELRPAMLDELGLRVRSALEEANSTRSAPTASIRTWSARSSPTTPSTSTATGSAA